jgi:alcohol dehydrogenase class IV
VLNPFSYVNTARVVFGAGVVRDLGVEVKALGCGRALLVTDRVLRERTEACARAERALGPRLAGIFDEVQPDAVAEVIDHAAEFARAQGIDCLVSLGGGSAIDTAKGIALCLALGGGIREHQGTQLLSRRAVAHVAIPTTAGTGSEVSVYAVVKDERAREKLHFMDERLIPDVALLDPELTVTMPPRLTAATGFDALTHSVESYTAVGAGPLSDAQALHAARLVARALPRAVERGDDLEARADMLVAANLAGAAMSNAGVGLAHAIAHALGARFGIHHGTANAIVLPHVVRFNAEAAGARYADLALAMGVRDVAQGCADLLAACGLPIRLRDAGVPGAELRAVAEAAVGDAAIAYNPRPAGEADVLRVLEAAW